MPIHNDDIARVFDEIADLLEIQGANVLRMPAYRNASREVRGLSRERVLSVRLHEFRALAR
jgi:DNA polymerase (family 10)